MSNYGIVSVSVGKLSCNMKFLFAILAIAMMIQVSMAGTLRLKRDDEVKEAVHEFITISKHMVVAMENSIKGTLEEMPKTDAYASYKTDLEEMLHDIEEFHDTPANCFFKTFALAFEFIGFLMKHGADGSTEEGTLIFNLLEKHGGDDVDKEFEAWQEKYSDKKMDPKIEKMSAEEALKSMEPLFTEVC